MDYVTSSVTNLDAVCYPKRLANEDVYPRDKAFHRRLDSETDDNRSDPERSNRGIPIDENYRNNNNRDNKGNEEMLNTLERETGGSILDMSKPLPQK